MDALMIPKLESHSTLSEPTGGGLTPTNMSELTHNPNLNAAEMVTFGETSSAEVKKKMSFIYSTDAHGQPVGLPLDLFLFSESIRRPEDDSEANPNSIRDFSLENQQPDTKQFPQFESGKMIGHIPLSQEFHMPSNRERTGPQDDGLEDADLTAADGIVRKKVQMVKRRSIIYDNIRTMKGEFIFPYRTYRPKVQVAYIVPSGHIPQAVVVERLHRLYKKTDINLVLQNLGVEPTDLIPPPNYCETNERFYQEVIFRSRVRVNGIFKKDFILHGDTALQEQEDHHLRHLHAPGPKSDDSVSSLATSSSEYESGSFSSSDSLSPEESPIIDSSSDKTMNSIMEEEEDVEEEAVESGNEGEEEGDETQQTRQSQTSNRSHQSHQSHQSGHHHHHHLKKDSIHPFIKMKPPFNPMLPLPIFDNMEFDIRMPNDWLSLGWDSKERKFYPLPGKAFLPLPGSVVRREAPALSETVVNNLLTSSPRLEKLFHWLLKERYERTIKMLGIDQNRIKFAPTEAELALLARLGSTVPCLFKESSQDLLTRSRLLLEKKSEIQRYPIDDSYYSLLDLGSMSDMSGESQMHLRSYNPDTVEVEGKSLPLYNVVYKKRPSKCPGDDSYDEDFEDSEDDGEDTGKTLKDGRENTDNAVKGEVTNYDEEEGEYDEEAEEEMGDEEATEAEEIEEDTEGRDYYTGLPLRNYIYGDNTPVRPSSPDNDALLDGHEKYVFEFEKMKKVHVYDWKWADVAVFDYNEKTNRYYVRTIYAPVVHAWVDKIYLCFDGEDPDKHGQRIRDAVIRRYEAENLMRFHLYLDSLPMTRIPSMSESLMESIVRRCLSTPRIDYTPAAMSRTKEEVNLEFRRTMARGSFIHVIEKHPKLYKPWVVIPAECRIDRENPIKNWKQYEEGEIPKMPFSYKVKKLQKLSVIFQKEPYEVYKKINEICLDARRRLMVLTELEPLHLDMWEKRQRENIAEIRRYLQEEWYGSIIQTLQEHLAKIPKSWYNIYETRYDVFAMSKLANFLQLIKIYMESTMRLLVTESLQNIIDQVKAVTKDIDYKRKFAWNEDDLMNSLYPTPKGVSQIWLLELVMDKDYPKCTQLLSSFGRVASGIFQETINSVKGLPALLSQIMPYINFASVGSLVALEETESIFVAMESELQKYIKRALLPVDTYVQLYKKYHETWNLHIPTFIEEWSSQEHTSDKVKELVEFHITHRKQLEDEIPHEINITGIRLIVENVRNGILRRKQNLCNALLDSYAKKLRGIIRQVKDAYNEIERKFNIRSEEITEVVELMAYVESISDVVEELESTTINVIKDYEIFDYFMYQISHDDSNATWQAALSSQRIMKLSRQAAKWLEADYNRLLQTQQSFLSALSDQVDSAALMVAGLVRFMEMEKASEANPEVQKVYHMVKDLQEHSELLNGKQKVFNLPLLQNHALEQLAKDIEPFKNLWSITAGWLKLQETIANKLLEEVDIDGLMNIITEGDAVIQDCIKQLEEADLDQIALVGSNVKNQMENFKPLLPLIGSLKNKALRQRHWDSIAKICGFVVDIETDGLKKLIDQGIQNFIKPIISISELATKEYHIEKSLDDMAAEMAQHFIQLDRDEETKQRIIILSPETLLTVGAFVIETEKLIANPFNKPFKQILPVWYKNIKRTKANMELWLNIQEQWLQIEPQFKAPDVPNRLPVEFKMYQKMNRIWRRLIRFARDTPLIIEIASDSTVMASINQFKDLIVKINIALEEHKRPKDSDEDSDD